MDLASTGALLGSGAAILVAVAGVLRNRDDHKRGVRVEDRSDVAALQARYQQILDDMDDHSIKILKERVDSLTEEISHVRQNLTMVEGQLSTLKHLYSVALEYITTLLHWSKERVPEDPPGPPMSISDDLN